MRLIDVVGGAGALVMIYCGVQYVLPWMHDCIVVGDELRVRWFGLYSTKLARQDEIAVVRSTSLRRALMEWFNLKSESMASRLFGPYFIVRRRDGRSYFITPKNGSPLDVYLTALSVERDRH